MKKIKKYIVLLLVIFFYGSSARSQDESSPAGYIVQKNDTLYGISRIFDVNLEELININHIANPNKLRVGQSLIIPPHAVKPKFGPIPSDRPRNQYVMADPPLSQRELIEEQELVEAGPDLVPIEPVEPKVAAIQESQEYMAQTDEYKKEFIGAGLSWWIAFLDAQAQISLGGSIGTDIDLVDDLGVDDSVGVPVVNLWLQPLSWLKIQGEYMNLGIDGSREIDEEIVYNGETFSISDTVRGELETNRFSGWVEFNPFNGSWGYAGASVGLEYVALEGELSSELVGSVSESIDASTFTLGGQFGINVTDQIQFNGRVKGMSFEISDVELEVIDFEVGLSYTVFEHFQLSGLYRYLFIDISENDNRNQGELTLQGPVIAASVKF